jgi:hypothetical protein
MKGLTRNRELYLASLPYAVLLLVTLTGFALVVGQAEAAMEELVVTAPRLPVTHVQAMGAEIADTAEDAVWDTQVSVASSLQARLNFQHRPYRLASRAAENWRKTG